MNVIWLLLQASRLSVAIAVLTGLISGSCSARLIALVNTAIASNSTQNLVWYFAGLALVALLTGTISQFLLIDLAQNAVYQLRLRLSQGIVSAPLRQLETLGANRLLATLTEDVQAISNSVFAIPFICIDLAVIVGCIHLLDGGFRLMPDEFRVVWRHAQRSRTQLGYSETVRQLTLQLQNCPPTSLIKMAWALRAALRGQGATVFDWLVALISKHQNVELILEE